jgi:hypothetical protein
MPTRPFQHVVPPFHLGLPHRRSLCSISTTLSTQVSKSESLSFASAFHTPFQNLTLQTRTLQMKLSIFFFAVVVAATVDPIKEELPPGAKCEHCDVLGIKKCCETPSKYCTKRFADCVSCRSRMGVYSGTSRVQESRQRRQLLGLLSLP